MFVGEAELPRESWRCVDLGCGKGRDAIYLARRSKSHALFVFPEVTRPVLPDISPTQQRLFFCCSLGCHVRSPSRYLTNTLTPVFTNTPTPVLCVSACRGWAVDAVDNQECFIRHVTSFAQREELAGVGGGGMQVEGAGVKGAQQRRGAVQAIKMDLRKAYLDDEGGVGVNLGVGVDPGVGADPGVGVAPRLVMDPRVEVDATFSSLFNRPLALVNASRWMHRSCLDAAVALMPPGCCLAVSLTQCSPNCHTSRFPTFSYFVLPRFVTLHFFPLATRFLLCVQVHHFVAGAVSLKSGREIKAGNAEERNLEPGELGERYRAALPRVLIDEACESEDGRPMTNFAACKAHGEGGLTS